MSTTPSTCVEARRADLVFALAGERITPDDFYRAWPVTAAAAPDLSLQILICADRQREMDAVEWGLALGFQFGFTAAHLPLLHALALAPWHHRHEDIARALDKLRRP